MVFSFHRGCSGVEFDLPGVREVNQYEKTFLCAGEVERTKICIRLDYSVPPRKLLQSYKPFHRLGLSGLYDVIETHKVSFYTEYIPFGEGIRKILFQLCIFENSLPGSLAKPVKELLSIPEIAAFLASIKRIEN